MTYHLHTVSALLLAAAGTAFAADYPPQLVGTYVYGKAATAEACKNPGIVIEKQARYNEVDASCKATAVKEVFEELQREQVVAHPHRGGFAGLHQHQVHPDASPGALKKRPTVHRQARGRMEHQGSRGCRRMLERQ
ncbi:MAG: hypothetical protein IPK34_18835 [Ramlibacter sp.]|nr:hypothetical protein [Ramlibacter sp.]